MLHGCLKGRDYSPVCGEGPTTRDRPWHLSILNFVLIDEDAFGAECSRKGIRFEVASLGGIGDQHGGVNAEDVWSAGDVKTNAK